MYTEIGVGQDHDLDFEHSVQNLSGTESRLVLRAAIGVE
jgi:hypothetical protein